jgi:hypothetical protein
LKSTVFDYLRAFCYERTRDQGTLGSIAIAIVEPLGEKERERLVSALLIMLGVT